ncbi:MAG: fructosamine kinase family protein [Cellvibrionaceae bacterium]
MDASLLKSITEKINSSCQLSLPLLIAEGVRGGDICDSYHLQDPNKQYHFFVKTHQKECEHLFKNEYNSLLAIQKTRTIRSPKAITFGTHAASSFLVLEHLLFSHQDNNKLLGQQLACLHKSKKTTSPHFKFGFFENNFIGTTPQLNTPSDDWSHFWIHQRLQPQIELAYQNGFKQQLQPLENSLFEASETLLKNHQPTSSLLHGDLWGGNKAFLTDGTPVIFDPACYYGDRETDIAMTRLFGGFSEAFYSNYNKEWPLPEGSQKREPLYNLYHQLNHLNLFGSGYLDTCINTIQNLVRQ